MRRRDVLLRSSRQFEEDFFKRFAYGAQFVEVRGGEYFFLPSMTALRMIGMGTIDPT